MSEIDAAERVARELWEKHYIPSDGRTIQTWDRVFFAAPCPDATATRPCPGDCKGTMEFFHPRDYLTGQWQCDTCTRLHSATVAETVGALLSQLRSRT